MIDLTILNQLTVSCGYGETSEQLDCIELSNYSSVFNEQVILIPYNAKLSEGSDITLTYSNEPCKAYEVVIING